MKHAYLLHTGYGKTKLVLDKLINSKRIPRTLLISTKNVVETAWSDEIAKWYPGKINYQFITGDITEQRRLEIINQPSDILGLNTEMLDWYISNATTVKRKDYTKAGIKLYYNDMELIKLFDLIVIDEVSLFKNSQSKRFKLIQKWCHHVQNVIILSATPTPKNIENIWSQIYLLDGGQRLGKNITTFRQNYAIPVALPNGYSRYDYTTAATDHVLSLIKDIVTSIPAPATPLFPEPIIKKGLIKADPATSKILETFKQDFIVKLSSGQNLIAFSKMQLIGKINQIANGFVYGHQTVTYINDLKYRVLQYKIGLALTPILVLYTYIVDKERLLTIPGAVLLDNPQAFADWNANKIRIGIMSPFSAAHGLNLQDSDCQDIYWYSPIWDTEKWIQTNARVCRRGQKKQVTITVLLMKGSYDEYAFDLCQDKFKTQYNNLVKLK